MDEKLEKKLITNLETGSVILPLVTSFGVGVYNAYTKDNADQLINEIALGTVLVSMSASFIFEKMNVKLEGFGEREVCSAGALIGIYSPIFYTFGYGIGKLLNL